VVQAAVDESEVIKAMLLGMGPRLGPGPRVNWTTMVGFCLVVSSGSNDFMDTVQHVRTGVQAVLGEIFHCTQSECKTWWCEPSTTTTRMRRFFTLPGLRIAWS